MKKYRPIRSEIVTAERWFRIGDAPEAYVISYGGLLTTKLELDRICKKCGYEMRHHGFCNRSVLDGDLVCPGNWVVKGDIGDFSPVKDSDFRATYEEAEEQSDENS